jgi:hypothetical protein
MWRSDGGWTRSDALLVSKESIRIPVAGHYTWFGGASDQSSASTWGANPVALPMAKGDLGLQIGPHFNLFCTPRIPRVSTSSLSIRETPRSDLGGDLLALVCLLFLPCFDLEFISH